MILERGNMWDAFSLTDWFLITTNPVRRMDGAVVMGRGIAKEAATRFPKLPYHFGECLDVADRFHSVPRVGTIGRYPNDTGRLTKIGFFMVKDHWAEAAKLSIIQESVDILVKDAWAEVHDRIDLNFPGIGNGKLKREDVLPILEALPNNVHVWEYD